MFVIIQARTGSTRLPNKIFKKVYDKPILEYCTDRLTLSKHISKNIIIATTTKQQDKPIVDFAKSNHFKYYKGSEHDVLQRYYKAAKKYKANTIIRITSDCPLIDPDVIDKTIDFFKSNSYDYVYNTWFDGSYPSGFDVQITSFNNLKKYHEMEKDIIRREHAFGGMVHYPNVFSCGQFTDIDKDYINQLSYNYKNIHLSVDTQQDFELIKAILKYFIRKYYNALGFRFYDVIDLLNAKPSLIKN